MTTIQRAGFWHSLLEPHLPKPQPYPDPWGRKDFLDRLRNLQVAATKRTVQQRVFCRLCNRALGNQVFSCKDANFDKTWIWPESLQHYVAEHNVMPDIPFIAFVTYNAERDVPGQLFKQWTPKINTILALMPRTHMFNILKREETRVKQKNRDAYAKLAEKRKRWRESQSKLPLVKPKQSRLTLEGAEARLPIIRARVTIER